MKKAGEILREKREAQGLGLQEVASILKINQKTLTAIERGETDGVLNKAFVKGFIRSYATYLKLDPKELLLLYQHETGEGTKLVYSSEETSVETAADENSSVTQEEVKPTPAPIPIEIKPKVQKQIPFHAPDNSQSYLLVGLLGLVVVLSVAFAIKATMKRYKNEAIVIPQPNIIQNSDQINMPAPAKPVTEEEMKALNTPAPDATALLTPAPADASAAPMSTMADSTKPQQSVETDEKPKAEDKPKVEAVAPKKEEPKPVVAEQPKPAPTAQTAVASPSPEKEEKPTVVATAVSSKEVIVESAGEVSVAYSMDGKTQTIQLKKDQVHTFKGKGPIKLQISDGQLVNVNVNGRDIGKPSTQAGPVSVTY